MHYSCSFALSLSVSVYTVHIYLYRTLCVCFLLLSSFFALHHRKSYFQLSFALVLAPLLVHLQKHSQYSIFGGIIIFRCVNKYIIMYYTFTIIRHFNLSVVGLWFFRSFVRLAAFSSRVKLKNHSNSDLFLNDRSEVVVHWLFPPLMTFYLK